MSNLSVWRASTQGVTYKIGESAIFLIKVVSGVNVVNFGSGCWRTPGVKRVQIQ